MGWTPFNAWAVVSTTRALGLISSYANNMANGTEASDMVWDGVFLSHHWRDERWILWVLAVCCALCVVACVPCASCGST